ncbi:MAG: helix-turn-helix domain-containing protein [Acidiferrobacteraceae bacterium]
MLRKEMRNNALATLRFNHVPVVKDLEDTLAKTALAVELNTLIKRRGLNQMGAAEITEMTQPKVSQLRRRRLENISLEHLMQALMSLGQHVEIVKPAGKTGRPTLTVAA